MSEDIENPSSENAREPKKEDTGKRSGTSLDTKRSFFSARTLLIVFASGGALFAALLVAFAIAYKSGTIDYYIEDQFIAAFDGMNVSMDTSRFELQLSPLKLYIENAKFKNKNTQAKLVEVDNLTFDLSVLDLFAMSSIRNVSIDRASLNGVRVWIDFDENGESNYKGIEIQPPQNNVRLQYAATDLSLRDGLVFFNDEAHSISGNAKNVSVFLRPDQDRKPLSDEIAYGFELNSKASEFVYDKEKIEPVDIYSVGRLNESGASIDKLELKTPLGTSLLSGSLKSWEKLSYELNLTSNVDLTRTSSVFPLGTSISGVGNFVGKVSGEGSKYKIAGEITSESLTASNVRLKALKINGAADGQGTIYQATGKAVAELLTFEDFRIEFPSLVGTVRGTGSDFKWFGELQAAALNSPLGTLGGLIISDGVAEYEDNQLIATLGNLRARRFSNDSVDLESIQTGNIRITSVDGETIATIPNTNAESLVVNGSVMKGVSVESAKVRNRNGITDVTADSGQVAEFKSDSTTIRNIRGSDINVKSSSGQSQVTVSRIESDSLETTTSKTNGLTAADIEINTDGNTTRINSKNVKIAKVDADAAILANLNIAGVRLTVRDGVIEGTSEDFDAGDIDLKENGKLNAVRVKKPVFVLEPLGRYRASLDMSLGGGVIGNVALGAAKATVLADNDLVELKSLSAEVMDGMIEGNAKIARSESRRSEINADFRDLDLSKLLALQGGRVFPVEGKTDGRAELTFGGTNMRSATGKITADISASAGTQDRGFIPVTGRFGATAVDGLFQIDYAGLNTLQSSMVAEGRFDLDGVDSSLTVNLDSGDASEIDRIFRIINIAPDIENQLDSYEIRPIGTLAFNGTIKGDIYDPALDGRFSLASLEVRGRELGSLAAAVLNEPAGFSVREGVLKAREGGEVKFGLNVPASGSDNTSLNASLNDIDLGNLMVLIPKGSVPDQLKDVNGITTGELDLSGLPGELTGQANLFTRNGDINGQTFKNLTSNAIFEKDLVRITKFDAGFGTGNLSATGFYRIDTTEFDVDLSADSIPAGKLMAFVPQSDSVPDITGEFELTAKVTGRTDRTETLDINFRGRGNRVAINKSYFGTIALDGQTQDRILNAKAETTLSGKNQLFTARVDFRDENLPFSAQTILDDSPIGPYLAIFRPFESGSVVIGGEVTGAIQIAGDLSSLDSNGVRSFGIDNLEGNANLSKASMQFDDTPISATEPVAISFNTREVIFENAKFAGSGSNLVVSGAKAFTDSGINNLAIDGRVNLGIVRAFSRNTLRNIFLAGIADVEIRLSGVNRTSRLNGTASLENGSAATFVGSNRISFERINGRIRFTTNQVQIDQVTAFLGGGQVTASGGALLNDNLALDKIRLAVRGTNITVPLPTDFTTTGNALIEINGRLDNNNFGSLVSGTVIARRSVYRKDIDLADLISGRNDVSLSQTVDTASASDVNYDPPRLDIRILGRDALRVRNNLADLSASADLRLTGDTETPYLSGRITATSGTIFFRDDKYEVQRGVLTFPPNNTADPRITLQAESEIRGYQVFVNLSGNLGDADSISAVVASNPSLPQADVTSLITTGNLSNTTDGIPTIAQGGLNTAAEILTNEIINKPIARATDKLFGLNRFELDPIVSGQKGNPTARLTVGRQINRNLLATYSTNLSQDQNQVLALEYRVSNRLSFVASYEQRSLTNVTQNRNKFVFEIRLRKRF